jgi:hypothetical protein
VTGHADDVTGYETVPALDPHETSEGLLSVLLPRAREGALSQPETGNRDVDHGSTIGNGCAALVDVPPGQVGVSRSRRSTPPA